MRLFYIHLDPCASPLIAGRTPSSVNADQATGTKDLSAIPESLVP